MVNRCIVGGCSNTNLDGISTHRFPKDRTMREKWERLVYTGCALKPCKLAQPAGASAGVPANLPNKTNPDWAPKLKLGHDKINMKTRLTVSRRNRINERSAKKARLEAAQTLANLDTQGKQCGSTLPDIPESNEIVPGTLPAETHIESGCQTELTGLQISQMEQCSRDMTCELVELKKKY